MKIKGNVVTGLGESGKFLAIDWVNREVCEKFKFAPFCGTLNIDIKDPAIQKTLKEHATERISSHQEGFCDALAFRGMINGRYECGVIIPLVPDYPEQILEIVAPMHLKETLGIKDGDEVELDLEV
jgi:riboflavin kinase, archaea type